MYRLSGWVMANAPLVGARVRVFATSGRPPDDAPLLAETRTVEEGRYELVLPRGGTMFALFEGGNRCPQLREFTTTPEEPEAEVLLALPRGRAITVTVVGDGDAPVAGALVNVWSGLFERLHYRTGADGRVPLVLASTNKLEVRAEGYAPEIVEPWLYKAGNRPSLDLWVWPERIVLERGIRLEGAVVDTAGRPVPRARVSNDRSTHFAETGVDGRFEWQHVPPATKRIEVRAKGYLEREVELASAPTPLVVTMVRAGRVFGTVVRADGTPCRSAEVTGVGWRGKAWTGRGGRFRLTQVPAGEIEIQAREPTVDSSFLELKAPKSIGRCRLRVTEGEELTGIRIVVRPPVVSFLRIGAAGDIHGVETSIECFDRSRDRLTSEVLLLVAAPPGSRVRVSVGKAAAIAVSAATVEDAKAAVLTVR